MFTTYLTHGGGQQQQQNNNQVNGSTVHICYLPITIVKWMEYDPQLGGSTTAWQGFSQVGPEYISCGSFVQ